MNLIDRQAAIDTVHRAIFDFFDICSDDDESPITYKDEQLLEINKAITTQIRKLPSAQPKIIYCGDCKYKDDGIDEEGIPFLKCLNGRSYGGTRINDFCSWAERRDAR